VSSPSSSLRDDARLFAGIFVLLCAYYLLWYAHFWPGVFDYDSGVYLTEVATGQVKDVKPFFYARFLQAFSLGGHFFPAAVVAQIVTAAAALARILFVARRSRVHPVVLVFLVALLINPYVAMMLSYVQNDVLFSVAVAVLCCEAAFFWRTQRITRSGLLVFMAFFPIAFFFRENGKLFGLMLWGFMVLNASARVSYRLLLAPVGCVALAALSAIGVDFSRPWPLVYPMVIHEVVGLARPEFAEPAGSKLSMESRQAVGEERLVQAVPFYSADLWDTIGFVQGGPKLLDLPDERKSRLIKSFFVQDLWFNLPAVVGHRIELFLTAATAQREFFPATYEIPQNLPEGLRATATDSRKHVSARGLARGLFEVTLRYRAFLWSPLPGVLLALALCLRGVWRRDRVALGIGVPLCAQTLLIAAFAPAAEFRYLFPLYLAPLAYWVARSPNSSPETVMMAEHQAIETMNSVREYE